MLRVRGRVQVLDAAHAVVRHHREQQRDRGAGPGDARDATEDRVVAVDEATEQGAPREMDVDGVRGVVEFGRERPGVRHHEEGVGEVAATGAA